MWADTLFVTRWYDTDPSDKVRFWFGEKLILALQGAFDTSLSGWGGFSFFIGMLPSAYT